MNFDSSVVITAIYCVSYCIFFTVAYWFPLFFNSSLMITVIFTVAAVFG